MKKILSLFLAVTFLFSALMPVGMVLAEENEEKVIYSESFEDGLGNWTFTSKSIQQFVNISDKEASDGKKSVHILDDSNAHSVGIVTKKFNAIAGKQYCVTLDAFGVSGSNKIWVKFFDANGKNLETKTSNSFKTGEWNTVKVDAIAPAETVSVSVTICGTIAENGEAYIDKVSLKEGKVVYTIEDQGFIPPVQVEAVPAELVTPVDNKLVYKEFNERGDKVADFSYAGFYAGDYQLPVTENLPVVAELSPSGTDDDTALIQNAIDKAYNEASNDKLKVIKLKAGKYNVSKNGINLKSGIVLSGEGQGPTGTIIYAKDATQYSVIKVGGSAPQKIGDNAYITDEYIKAGSKTFNVSLEDAAKYKVGDLITIFHESTDKWAEAIDMVNIKNVYDVDSSWGPGEVDMETERTITAINGTEITIDFPLFVPYIKELSPSYIYKTADENRGQNIGIENLRIESYYNGKPDDENHATTAITISNAKNVFVRDVSAKYFYGSLISSGAKAKQITAVNCSNLEPVSKISGSRRYSYASSTSAQQILYTGCYSYAGRHDYETSFTVTGPIAYVDNVADASYGGIETHGTWSTGVLFDNIYSVPNNTKGDIGFQNRGIYGSQYSQGWTTASAIAWNCLAPAILIHNLPQYYQNFLVGTFGIYKDPVALGNKQGFIDRYKGIYRTSKHQSADVDLHYASKEGSAFIGDGTVYNEFTSVEPRSLYKAQLSERYTGVISNAKPNAPVIIGPACDARSTDKNISITGICQLGAEKVTVYIDNKPYEAKIEADNSYKLDVALENGVHKIYATQTIKGTEGNKTSDRFIIIGNDPVTENPEYLQSIYPPEVTSMLINDTRPTYDVYEKTVVESVNDITVIVDGAKINSDVAPFETNGRVLVPMRAIFEALKANVSWDEATATATAVSSNGYIEVKITENQTTAYVNNEPITLDVPATIIDGRFVVPVRFISESLGASVSWSDPRKMVTILSSYMSNNPKAVPAKNAKWSHSSAVDRTGAQAIDGNPDTRWAGNEKGVWMSAEFMKKEKITSFKTLFGSQTSRTYNFEIYFSEDGENYKKVFEGTTSNNADGDLFTLSEPCEAKYFKFVGQGGSNTDWILLHEIEFYKE